MKRVLVIMLVIAMFITSTVYATTWSGTNSVTIVEPSKVEILPNGDFSVASFSSETTPYGSSGYRGYSYGLMNNIKGMNSQGEFPVLPVDTLDEQHGNSLKLELNNTGNLTDMRFVVGVFHMTDATKFRSDYDFGEYNRTIDMNAPVYKNDKEITVKFDVYKPKDSSLKDIRLFIRSQTPGPTYYTRNVWETSGSPASVKVEIIPSKAAADFTDDTFVTVEKSFKFSDYPNLVTALNAGHYVSFELCPTFNDATKPVVYIDNYSISYLSDGVYQTPDTNMISKLTIGEAYKSTKWITEDTTVTYGDGDKSYKFIPHNGNPRPTDNAIFNSNFYRDLTMTIGSEYTFNQKHTYRFSCWVKADTAATKLNGAQLRIHKNGGATELLGMTSPIVNDGEWHQLTLDFVGDTSLTNISIGLWKNCRDKFAEYNSETGEITGGDEVTFYLADPKISVQPVYLELELIKENETTAALAIQNLSPVDTYFNGIVIIAEYEAEGGKLVNVAKSDVDETLAAYEGRTAVRARLTDVADGHIVKVFLWQNMGTLMPLLPCVEETVTAE